MHTKVNILAPFLVAILLLFLPAASHAQVGPRANEQAVRFLDVFQDRRDGARELLLRDAAEAATSALPGNTLTAQMGIQFKDRDHVRGELAAEAGFGVIRKGLYWSRVESTSGQYDFVWFDEIVDQAKARGMVVSATLYGNNPLYGYHREDGVAIITEAGRQGFARFAAAAAARYADDPVVFEIWNEPNLRQFWRAHPADPNRSNIAEMADEYTLLVQAAVPAMREAHPDAFISAGSVSALWRQSFSWFDRAVEKGILDSGIDAISVHPYGFEWPEMAEGDGYSVIRSKLARAGRSDIALVNTEVGFPASEWITERGYTFEEAVNLQGALLIRQQLLDHLYGLKYSIWYEFRSSDTYGILDPQFNPRPAYTAAKTMHDELVGYELMGRVQTRNQEDFLLRFTNGTADKIVAWTSPPPFRKKAVPHTILIDYEVLSITDTFGQSLAIDGQRLRLSEYPQFVTIGSAIDGAGTSDQLPKK